MIDAKNILPTNIGRDFNHKVVLIYFISLCIAVLLQASHYVFYYKQQVVIATVWSFVDWNIWLLMFLTLFYFKQYNQHFDTWTKRKGIFLMVVCFLFPLLHTLLSNSVFLIIYEPTRPFVEDLVRQFSKKWFQNIFIGLGGYFLSDYVRSNYLNAQENSEDAASEIVQNNKLLVKDGKSRHLLIPTEIEWIQAAKNYVVIGTTSGKQLVVRKTISSMYNMLKEAGFIKISRSTIVHKSAIAVIEKRTKYSYSVNTKSNKDFPVGKTYVKTVLACFD